MIKRLLFSLGFFLLILSLFFTLSGSYDYCSCAEYIYGYSYQDYLRDNLLYDSVNLLLTVLGLTSLFICFIFYFMDSRHRLKYRLLGLNYSDKDSSSYEQRGKTKHL